MQADYKEQSWFANLSAVQRGKLEDLREAQRNQGDMEELKAAP